MLEIIRDSFETKISLDVDVTVDAANSKTLDVLDPKLDTKSFGKVIRPRLLALKLVSSSVVVVEPTIGIGKYGGMITGPIELVPDVKVKPGPLDDLARPLIMHWLQSNP